MTYICAKKEGRSSAPSIEEARSSPTPSSTVLEGVVQGCTSSIESAEERPSFFGQICTSHEVPGFPPAHATFLYDPTRGPMVCTGNENGRKHLVSTPIDLNSTPQVFSQAISRLHPRRLKCTMGRFSDTISFGEGADRSAHFTGYDSPTSSGEQNKITRSFKSNVHFDI